VGSSCLGASVATHHEDDAISDEDGRFEVTIQDAPVDGGATVRVECDGYVTESRAVAASSLGVSGAAPILVELERALLFHARVVHVGDERVVRGALVTLLPASSASLTFLAREGSNVEGDATFVLSPTAARGARITVEYVGRRFLFDPLTFDADPPAELERVLVIDAPVPHVKPNATAPRSKRGDGGVRKH
jgi:hypothetical protein